MSDARSRLLRTIRPDGAGPGPRLPYAWDGSHVVVSYTGRMPPENGADEWGVTWAPLPVAAGPEEPLNSFPASPAATSLAELAARPDPLPPASEAFAPVRGAAAGEALVIGMHPSGPLDRFQTLLGMESAMLALVRRPDETAAMMQRIASHHIAIAQGYLAAGADAGWVADDYAGNGGPYLAPAQWRRVVLPALARIFTVYRDAGAPVFFHTCGQSEVFIGDLIDAGAEVFNLQSECCDLPALKRRFGRRIAFYCGVSSQTMMEGGPQAVRAAVGRAVRDLWDGGGLILAPDQFLAFPPAHKAAFLAAARDASEG